jgi:hypothetical protein
MEDGLFSVSAARVPLPKLYKEKKAPTSEPNLPLYVVFHAYDGAISSEMVIMGLWKMQSVLHDKFFSESASAKLFAALI